MRSSTTTAPKSVDTERVLTPPAPRACHPRWVREKATVTRTWRRLNSLERLGEGTVLLARHIASKKSDASASGFLLAFTRSYSQDPGWFLFRRLLICLSSA